MLISAINDRVTQLSSLFPVFLFKNACGEKRQPCHNDATCQSGFTNKGYRCLCTPGFEGEHCEHGTSNV